MPCERINQGPVWLQRAINSHATDIEHIIPISGDGITVADSPSGAGRSVNYTGPRGGSSSAAAILTEWQPYVAPWTGGGAEPADWGLNIMLRPGEVSDGTQILEPSNLNLVFTVPSSCTEGYRIWLAGTVNADGTLSALDYDSGLDLPDQVDTVTDSTGTLPAQTYCQLCVVTSSATAVDLANVQQRQSTSLNCTPQIVNLTSSGAERRMVWYPGAPDMQS